MTVANDEVYQEARELEDGIFRQRQFIEDQPEDSPFWNRFEVTWRTSRASLARQLSLEKAYGTPDWTAAKLKAIQGNKMARKVLDANREAGIIGRGYDR
jgi:hypothetical protein